MPKVVIKHITKDVDRHGNVRVYYRKRGVRKVRLRGPVGSDEFWEDYSKALNGKLKPSSQVPKDGTFRWLCEEYYSKCDEFKALEARSRLSKKRHLDLVSVAHGAALYADLERRNVLKLRDDLKNTPGGKNNLIVHLRGLYVWAIERELVKSNPTDGVKRLKVSKPHHTATIEEINKYLKHHKIGSKARLGLALGLYTGLRVSDLARLGRQHIRNNTIVLTPSKTAGSSRVIIEIPVLPELQSEIARVKVESLTILAKSNGTQYAVKSLSNLFKEWFVEAGVPECSVHSLRKAAATLAAENGATVHELQALFGWTTLDQPERYTREASRKNLAKRSAHLINLGGHKE